MLIKGIAINGGTNLITRLLRVFAADSIHPVNVMARNGTLYALKALMTAISSFLSSS